MCDVNRLRVTKMLQKKKKGKKSLHPKQAGCQPNLITVGDNVIPNQASL